MGTDASPLRSMTLRYQWALSRASKEHGDLAASAGNRAEYLARNAESLLAMGMVTNTVNGWGEVHARALAAADKAAQLNAWFAGLSRV